MMTKAYSIAFKQKMVERLTGKNAVNLSELGREIGIRQQNLSQCLHDARSLPAVASDTATARLLTVEQNTQALAGASNLSGEQLTLYFEREGIKLADFERWRIALQESGQGGRPHERAEREVILIPLDQAQAGGARLVQPGMTATSLLPQAAEVAGIDFPE